MQLKVHEYKELVKQKKRAKPRPFEEDLCVKAFDIWQRLGPINARIFHIPNGGDRGKDKKTGAIIGHKLKKMGTVAGFWDYLVLFDDCSFGLVEAKLDEKRLGSTIIHSRTDLSQSQKDFFNEITDLLGSMPKHGVFRTVRESVDVMINIGVEFKIKDDVKIANLIGVEKPLEPTPLETLIEKERRRSSE